MDKLDEAIAAAVDGCRKVKSYIETSFKQYMTEAIEGMDNLNG